MASDLERAAIFYNRAAELRGISENVKDPDTKDAMVKWAETYEGVARRIIEALPSDKPGPPSKKSN